MAKRTRKTRASERPISELTFALAGCGFGLACVAAGVLVLVFGVGSGQKDSGVPTRNVAAAGGTLIAIGAVAVGFTLFLVYTRRKEGKRKRKSKRRKR